MMATAVVPIALRGSGIGALAASARHRYAAFGSVLESEIEFPELVAATSDDAAHWILRVATTPPPACEVQLVGGRQVGLESYALSRTPVGYRLEYSRAEVFDLSHDGREIVWYHRTDAIPELVRSIVLGPVLALSLDLSGLLCLHGSAVAIDGKAVAFLGPKHHGKSTLATALTAAGARLVGDDLIAVVPGTPAMVRPGVPSVRLWDDAVRALTVDELCARVVRGVKTTATGFADRAFTEGLLPLDGVYLLAPTTADAESACTRAPLSPAAAAIGLAQQTKLADSLIGMNAAAAKLATAARLAASVPVWTLATARDMSRLTEVVTSVMAWHARTP